MSELAKLDLKYIWHPCSQMHDYESLPPIVIKRAKGVFLYDEDDKRYIDIISSWWCNLLGHSNERINEAIKVQLDRLEHVIFANFTHESAINLSSRLVEILPKGLVKLNFSDNGSSAVESALKMAFQYHYQTGKPNKTRFMCLEEGYHGETIGALSVGTMDLYAKIYKPMLMDVIRIKSPDCYRCEFGLTRQSCSCECFCHAKEEFEKHGHETAAIIIEPLVQGAAGMRIYPALYLKKLREICDAYDVLLIADEIATGFGRTGKMFAFDHAGVSPDIMTLSKGLTGGYMPMSITATTQKIYDAFYAPYSEGKAFMHSHTYSGNPLGCAAALAVLDIVKNDDVLTRANKTAKFLNETLSKVLLGHKNVGEIRQIGLINAIELVEDKSLKQAFKASRRVGYEIYKKALKNGLLLRPLGDVIYFNPPLNITQEECEKAVALCEKSIREILG
ncbi:adenosylmethionine--8-amino-7-oxononanoate transaminase [Campylobacter sp. RM13119]|uniref:adenosylmethionine--8-amino-7-oxononanoate transaminase n=2 Tax=Campylobacter TaxID=194 RepID=UPI001475D28A|nr:adenosylmethionine--8-amino-7-oxononanoate transaminase [Campylobacter sp. RM13119]MBE3605961.1 adenosylmethionine--8-amino-7-oxononanoate transaminase [Campylobacter sp. RM13119]